MELYSRTEKVVIALGLMVLALLIGAEFALADSCFQSEKGFKRMMPVEAVCDGDKWIPVRFPVLNRGDLGEGQ